MNSELMLCDSKRSQKTFLAVFLLFLFSLITAQADSDTLPDSIVGNAGPLSGNSVHYYSSNLSSVGYLSKPDGEGPHPSVILIHEWNGLVQRVKETADSSSAAVLTQIALDTAIRPNS